MLPALTALPFAAALLVAVFARTVPSRRRPPAAVMALSSLVAFAMLLTPLPGIVDGETVTWSATWVSVLDWELAFRLDGLSLLFGLLITGIGTLIGWYGGAYMGNDERNARFFATLLIFQAGMLIAVLADGFIVLFVGWELTSIASFALIGFQHHQLEARQSAQHALLITGGGGIAMLGGFILLGASTGTWRISELTREQVLALDTTSVNFYQLCEAAIKARPDRDVVISDTANFPTDRYILEGLCDRYGKRLVLIDDESNEEYVTAEMLQAHLSKDVALVTFSVIQYRSGALHDVRRLTQMAHESGALVVWDASHAVGVVDLKFDAADVDLAVGCTYKYCNSGPGSPAWLYVNKRLQKSLQVPIQGWFAQRDQFSMGQGFERAEGMRGFQIASPSIVGLRCVETAVEMIREATLPAITAKAAKGTEMMLALHDEWLAHTTECDPSRGSHHHEASGGEADRRRHA